MLATTRYGETGGSRAPLLIAHGLFGSGKNFGVIARNLAKNRPVITVDMRTTAPAPGPRPTPMPIWPPIWPR